MKNDKVISDIVDNFERKILGLPEDTGDEERETYLDDIEIEKAGWARANPFELWWCNTHSRRAEYIHECPGFVPHGEHCCEPLGGIMIPCKCVNLTGIAEIEVLPNSANAGQG